MHNLSSGKVFAQKGSGQIQTVLGSCIAVCIRDVVAKVSGMNHFALPVGSDASLASSGRYGAYAMELLINDMLKLGAHRGRMEVSYAGGAVLHNGFSKVGWMNIGFVESYCQTEELRIINRDAGGILGRKLIYNPLNGMLDVTYLKGVDSIDESSSSSFASSKNKEAILF